MTAGDLEEVLAIERVSFPNPWTRSMFEGELKNPVSFSYTLKADSGGRKIVAGYVVFWIVYGEAHVLNLAVHPAMRRRGIGEALMEFAIDRMRDAMVYGAFLEVRKSNGAARALYRKLGFKESYEREKYYGDEDAVVMTLNFEE